MADCPVTVPSGAVMVAVAVPACDQSKVNVAPVMMKLGLATPFNWANLATVMLVRCEIAHSVSPYWIVYTFFWPLAIWISEGFLAVQLAACTGLAASTKPLRKVAAMVLILTSLVIFILNIPF